MLAPLILCSVRNQVRSSQHRREAVTLGNLERKERMTFVLRSPKIKKPKERSSPKVGGARNVRSNHILAFILVCGGFALHEKPLCVLVFG